MFEFIDIRIIAATILLLISYILLLASNSTDKKQKGFRILNISKIFLMLIPMIPVVSAVYQHSDAKENIKQFNEGKALECHIGENTYLVTSSTGWEVTKYSFLKDSLLIRSDKCKE